AGRAHKQDVLVLSDEGTGRERVELRSVDTRLERPVERLERLAGREPGELERGADAPLVLALDLLLEHVVEEVHGAQVLTARLLDELGEAERGVYQLERAAMLGDGIEIDRAALAHRSASTSWT